MKESPAVGILRGEAVKIEMEAQRLEANAATQTTLAQGARKDAAALRASIKILKTAEERADSEVGL